MDEYIKREDALDAVLFALVGTGHQSIAIQAIRDVSAADVVPKIEVERLRAALSKMAADLQEQYAEFAKRQLPSYCQACSEEEAINIGREYGKTEVAREIFAEIEREFCGAYWYKGYTIERYIASLKKKYTEGKHDAC